jgi:hypothetical protein
MRIAKSLSDSATLDQSSEQSSLPAVAVQRVQPRDIWRSYDNSDQWLTFNLGSQQSFDFVAVLYHNCDQNCLWRIRTANTEANLTASPTYDSTASVASPQVADIAMRNAGETDTYARFHAIKDIGSQTNQWVRLDFETLTGITELEIGRVMICSTLQQAPAYNWQLVPQQDAFVIPTVSGLWTHAGRKYRTVSWSYPALTDVQAFRDAGVLDAVGHSLPLVACVDEADSDRQTDYTFYGVIENVSNTYLLADANLKQYTFREFERP